MQKLEIKITVNEGESFTVQTSASDLIKWENYFDLSIDKLEKLTHLYYLSWLASFRLGKTNLEFEVWVDQVQDVVVEDPKG